MPKHLALDELRSILSEKRFDELLDTIEDEFLDFKRDPYRLEDEDSKRSLAEDVSKFANA